LNILYTTPILHYPSIGGPYLRIENSIKALARISKIDIIYRASHPCREEKKTNIYFSKYTKKYTSLYYFSKYRYIRFFQKIFCLFFDKDKKHINFFLSYIKNNNIEIIWFGFGNISYHLMKKIKLELPKVKIVCDTDSVWSRFVLRGIPYVNFMHAIRKRIIGKKKQKEEKNWVDFADVTTAVSDIDAKYYKKIVKNKSKIKIFSNVIDIFQYKKKISKLKNFKNPSILLSGSFGPNSPMNVAAKWVLDEILPKLHKIFPRLHFYIVGNGSDKEFGHLKNSNITVTGTVTSVLPYLCHTDVALVPLKFESGTRFKILEAGACRIPIVSTTLGAEGIPVVNNKHILIANTSKNFTEAVLKIIKEKNLGKKISKNCCNLVKSNFTISNLATEAKNILKYLRNA
jgi:glycosyltransferase involved in cell wall biosynthesis